MRQGVGTGRLAYESKAVTLMAFGFALVNIDRFILFPLFPVVMQDLHLDYEQLGFLTGVVAVTWSVASVTAGWLADRIGRRRILWGSVLAFSVFCGLTGAVNGVVTMLVIRGVMGVFEGAYTPTSIAATVDASQPHRVGRNLGIQQLVAPVFGVGVAPVLATQLLHVLPSWRWVFVAASLPGLICSLLIYRVIREPVQPSAVTEKRINEPKSWAAVFKYRNMVLNLLGFPFWLGPLLVLSAMMPNYLTDYLHLKLDEMGFVISAMGVGGGIGMFAIPTLSDRIGRKQVASWSLALVVPLLWVLMHTGARPVALFALLFTICSLLAGVVACVHAITADTVPRSLVSTATGLVIGVGELFGGGVVPAIIGAFAKVWGIQIVLPMVLACATVGLIVALAQQGTRSLVTIKQGTL